jgi:hypothetical protein
MATTILELDQLYQALQQVRGRKRLSACQAFCQAIIGAQRRGELGIMPAVSWVEAALEYPELQEHPQALRLQERVCAMQSLPRSGSDELVAEWREVMKSIERLTL